VVGLSMEQLHTKLGDRHVELEAAKCSSKFAIQGLYLGFDK
jgi:hypothetical protein